MKYAVLLLYVGLQAAASGPNHFVYQGLLEDSSGNVIADTASFTVEVLPPGEDCVMYREIHDLDLSTTDGEFSLSVGAGDATTNAGPVTKFFDSIVNDGSNLCGAYTSTPGDARRVRITVTSGGQTSVMSPDIELSSVPSALMANDTYALQGKSLVDLVQVNSGTAELTQTNLENIFSTSNYLELTKLLDGTSTSFTIGAGAVSNNEIADVAVDKITSAAGQYLTYAPNGAACSNGEVLKMNAGNWECGADQTAGAGTIGSTEIVDGSVDTVDLAAGAVTDAKITGMSASKLTGALPAIDGSSLTGLPAPVVGSAEITDGSVDTVDLAAGAVTDAKIAGMSSSKLTGALPAIDGSNLTGIPNLSGGGTVTGVIQLSATNFDANSNKVINLGAPTGTNDATNKDYVDQHLMGVPGSAPANGQVLIYDAAGPSWMAHTPLAGGSNVGSTGVGVYKQVSGGSLEFLNIAAGDGTITVTHDTGNNEIDITANFPAVGSAEITDGAITNLDINAAAGIAVSKLANPADPAQVLVGDGSWNFLSSLNSNDNITLSGGTDGSGLVEFLTAGTQRMNIQDNGRIGIGVATPQSMLDVGGIIKFGYQADTCIPALDGAVRYSSPNLEICDGSAWNTISSGSGGPLYVDKGGINANDTGGNTVNGTDGATQTFNLSGGGFQQAAIFDMQPANLTPGQIYTLHITNGEADERMVDFSHTDFGVVGGNTTFVIRNGEFHTFQFVATATNQLRFIATSALADAASGGGVDDQFNQTLDQNIDFSTGTELRRHFNAPGAGSQTLYFVAPAGLDVTKRYRAFIENATGGSMTIDFATNYDFGQASGGTVRTLADGQRADFEFYAVSPSQLVLTKENINDAAAATGATTELASLDNLRTLFQLSDHTGTPFTFLENGFFDPLKDTSNFTLGGGAIHDPEDPMDGSGGAVMNAQLNVQPNLADWDYYNTSASSSGPGELTQNEMGRTNVLKNVFSGDFSVVFRTDAYYFGLVPNTHTVDYSSDATSMHSVNDTVTIFGGGAQSDVHFTSGSTINIVTGAVAGTDWYNNEVKFERVGTDLYIYEVIAGSDQLRAHITGNTVDYRFYFSGNAAGQQVNSLNYGGSGTPAAAQFDGVATGPFDNGALEFSKARITVFYSTSHSTFVGSGDLDAKVIENDGGLTPPNTFYDKRVEQGGIYMRVFEFDVPADTTDNGTLSYQIDMSATYVIEVLSVVVEGM